MITTINEYTRNPQYLKSLFKKIYRGIDKIVDVNLQYKIGTDNNYNNIKYSDVLSNNYTYLNFEVGHIPEKDQKRVKQFLDDFKKDLEEKYIVMSYYESCYDAGYDVITMKHSGKRDIQCYYKIYVKDAMGKRIKPPKYVYHSSPVSNREKIRKEGIKVSYPKNWKQEGMHIDYMPAIFAVKSNEDVWHGEGDIWQIDTTKIDNKWWDDLNLYKSPNWGGNAIMTFEDIPPHAIEETIAFTYDDSEETIEESMLDKFRFFKKKKQEEIKEPRKNVNIEDLDIEEFNEWFKNEYSGYGGYPGSAKGIFLRTDKLSSGMINDYFDYLNIESDDYRFMDRVRDNWIKKLHNNENMITRFEDYDKEYVKGLIRDVVDFPKKGITFKDIQLILQDPQAVRYIVDDIYENIKTDDIDVVLGLDARGFILGPMIAQKLGVGFAMARKKGKLPPPYVQSDYELEYGNSVITVSPEIIRDKMRVHIHDDLLATSGTLNAAIRLIEKLGCKVTSISTIIELKDLKGREKIKNYNYYTFLSM